MKTSISVYLLHTTRAYTIDMYSLPGMGMFIFWVFIAPHVYGNTGTCVYILSVIDNYRSYLANSPWIKQ